MLQGPDFSPEPPKHNDVKSLIFGIVSLIFCQLPLVPIATGITAVVLSSKAKAEMQSSRNLAAGGLITGIIGICLGVISSIYWLFVFLSLLLLLHQEHNLMPEHPNPDFYNAPGKPAVLRALFRTLL